ncbi:hypothetical protein HJFPF1_00313 [Paramyrothecium foliicola]|nr:hypothetical protein HJFPF1_00313 [Paramyrothecium foliicola]
MNHQPPVKRLRESPVLSFASTSRSISPPPLKRPRKEEVNAVTPTLPTKAISPLEDAQFRIFTWNINGIQPFLQRSIQTFFRPVKTSSSSIPSARSAANFRDCLRRWHWPQVLCLQEVKIAPRDTSTQESVKAAVKAPLNSSEPSYEAYFSLPRDKFNARGFGGKVYGVCTLVRRDIFAQQQLDHESAAVPVDWDLEGRVLSLRLYKSKLLLLNIYAVNGTDNSYRDPLSGTVISTRHSHKREFHSRLRDMIAFNEEQGWDVVVAGDMNIARSPIDGFPGIRLGTSHVENRRDFENKFMKPRAAGGLEMVDSFRHFHGGERKYTYRSPSIPWGASCDRVDLILLSSSVLLRSGMLIGADILDDETERATSDHLPSYITLGLDAHAARATADLGVKK